MILFDNLELSSLEKAIQDLYRVFSKYKKPLSFSTCECCVSEQEMKFLLSKPLKSLTAGELEGYESCVLGTIGAENDFKYFFPRILELHVTDQFSYPESITGKLKKIHWQNWPAEDQQTIHKVFDEKLNLLFSDIELFDVVENINDWICAIAICVHDITPYLNKLMESDNEEALKNFVECNIPSIYLNKMDGVYWESAPHNAQVTLNFLNQEKLKKLLPNGFQKAK